MPRSLISLFSGSRGAYAPCAIGLPEWRFRLGACFAPPLHPFVRAAWVWRTILGPLEQRARAPGEWGGHHGVSSPDEEGHHAHAIESAPGERRLVFTVAGHRVVFTVERTWGAEAGAATMLMNCDWGE